MMKKTILCIAFGSACITTTASAIAALPNNAILGIDAGVGACPVGGTFPNCNYGLTDVASGSYFAMDTNANGFQNGERVIINAPGSDGGITLAGAQPGHGVDGPTAGSTDASGNLIGTALTAGQINGGWDFFGAHGWDTTTAAPTITFDDGAGNVTLGMAGWLVHWNGGDIDMGQGADATMTCSGGANCGVGDTYVLDYAAVVPSGSFAGVNYQLHLEGTIALPSATNSAPVANDDAVTVDRKTTGRTYVPSVIDILFNDSDVNGTSDIDKTSVIINPAGTDTTTGNVALDQATGLITYTPVVDTLSPPTDSFTYTVTDKGGPTGTLLTSNTATVTITIQNAVPVAVDDSYSIDTATATSILLDVAANDTDSDGSILNSSVTITTNGAPAKGVISSIDPTSGVITYTPNTGSIGTDIIKYTVTDNDSLVSNVATVTIIISNSNIAAMPANAYLTITTGNVSGNTQSEPADGNGSWFHMEVNPGKLTFVSLSGLNGVSLGVGNAQAGSVSFPEIDNPWAFFGPSGVHQTTSDVTVLTDDAHGNVTLDFSGWDVSWNGLPSIPLNSRAHTTGFVDGIAKVTCLVDCSFGDSYILEYSATVPDKDPSDFGNVKYFVHLEGVISDGVPKVGGGNSLAAFEVTGITAIDGVLDTVVEPGSAAQAVGKTTGLGLSAGDIGQKDPLLNSADGQQCIGGCVDFVINNVTTAYVDLVFKLSTTLPAGGTYRKYIDGAWKNFNKSQGDEIGSAASQNGKCQRPEGVFSSSLREGFDCIYMRIYDNGPNDADARLGVIADPSGTLLQGSPNTPPGTTSGCSISATEVSLSERADWILVAGFIAWLGMIGYRRNKSVNQ